MRVNQLGTIDEKQAQLTLRLPKAEIQLTAKGLEQLIVDLIGFRQRMLPIVTPMPHQGEKVPVIPDPLWELTPSVDGTQLHVFYNGLGWLHYAFSREQIGDLAKAANAANTQSHDPPQTRQ